MYRGQLWVPVKDKSGQVAGVYLTLHDTTLKVLSERRAIVLRELSERAGGFTHRLELIPASKRLVEDVDKALIDTFEANPRDAPFALIFHVESTTPNCECLFWLY